MFRDIILVAKWILKFLKVAEILLKIYQYALKWRVIQMFNKTKTGHFRRVNVRFEAYGAQTFLSPREATLANVREEKPAKVCKWRSQQEGAAASHHELLASSRCVFRMRKRQKNRAAEIFVKFRKIHADDRKVMMDAQVAKWSVYTERLAFLNPSQRVSSCVSFIMGPSVTEALKFCVIDAFKSHGHNGMRYLKNSYNLTAFRPTSPTNKTAS